MKEKLRPGDYELGSISSRAAARTMIRQTITTVVIMTGLPSPDFGPPIITAPDTIEHYLAPDGSIVEVVCREYQPGKFSAFIDQTWPDGSVYNGDCWLGTLEEVKKLPSIRNQKTT